MWQNKLVKKYTIKKTFLILILGLTLFSPIFNDFVKAESELVQTSLIVHLCGNEIVEGDEVCDDGANNGSYGSSAGTKYCNAECTGYAIYCGDGIIQAAYGEECDDGNNNSGDGCRSDCKTEAAQPPVFEIGGVYVPPVVTKVILQGKAQPEASITVLVDGKIATVKKADSQADFEIELTTLTTGIYNFSLWSEDRDGRKSISFSFSVTITYGMTTTISGIFIPPTIELEKTSLLKGEILNISGQTAPQSEVSIYVESSEEIIIKKTTADNRGRWSYSFNTSELDGDPYSVKAKSISPDDLISSFSNILNFTLGKEIIEEFCPEADLNKDGRVDLIDFSILLYWWGRYDPCADQNQDGTVNLQDFSIMMYYWTG